MYDVWVNLADYGCIATEGKKMGKNGNQICKIAILSFTFHSNNVPIHLLITARWDKTAFATDFTKCCFSSFFTGNMEI